MKFILSEVQYRKLYKETSSKYNSKHIPTKLMRNLLKQNFLIKVLEENKQECSDIPKKIINIYKKLEEACNPLGFVGKFSDYLGFGDGTNEDLFLSAINELSSVTEISQLEEYFRCYKESFWKFSGTRGTLRGLIYHEFDERNSSDKKYINLIKNHLGKIGYNLHSLSDQEYRQFQLGTIDWVESEFIEEYYHGIIDFLAIVSLFTGPFGKTLSFLFESLNIGLYLKEGDKYSAGLRICFSLIPGAELSQKIPGFRNFTKKYILSVFDKVGKFSVSHPNTVIKLTQREKQALDLVETYAPTITKMANGKVLLQYLYLCLEKNSLAQMYRVLSIQFFKHYWQATAGKIILTTGGIIWTWDKIAKYLGVTPMYYKNDQKGFEKFCNDMGLKYVGFNTKSNQGTADAVESGSKIRYIFFYDSKIKSFMSNKITEILEQTPVPTKVETEIKNQVILPVEKAIFTDSIDVKKEFDRLMDSINNSGLKNEIDNKVTEGGITQIPVGQD